MIEEFKIYNPSGELILSTFVDDSSYRLREIMGVNSLELRFSLPEFVPIIEGSYCDFMAERYFMPRAVDYVKEHTEKFNYSLSLEGSINFLKSTKFKFFDYLASPSPSRRGGRQATSDALCSNFLPAGEGRGGVVPTSSFKLKFPITATPRDIATLLVVNLKLKYPQYPWAVGDCIESEPVIIDFNHDFCFDVLPKLAEAFNTEWEVAKYTIHVGKVEKMKDSTIDLSYGYNNGILGGIRRMQFDSTRIINRVYIEGGERNIDRSTYGRDRSPNGSDTLLLPKSKIIAYEGIEYTTDASGSYLERYSSPTGGGGEGVGAEDSLDVSKFYPKRVGVVSEVEEIDEEKGFYNIIDTDIPAELDFSKSIIAGETMTLIFQTGQLAGKEFDVKYIHDKQTFELVPIDENGLIYPQGHLIPAVGDTYAVFHMRMPDIYISDAEGEALQETAKYLWENEQAQYTYRWQLDAIHARRNWGEIRGFLNCGFFVKFSDPQFLPDGVDIRIVAIKEPANDPQSPEITIANNVSSRTLGSVINEIPTIEQAVDRKDGEVVSYVKRGFKQANETMQMLIESLLNFDEAIKPIAVQTMMLLIGDESLQFRYVDQRENPTPQLSGIGYNATDKRLVCPVGIIQHMTLGITSLSSSHATEEYKFWDTKAYQSDVLTDPQKSYFLYLKAPIGGAGAGSYLISAEGIKMEADPNYYHFLVGILNSEDEDGNRSWVEMFGLTEILPGRITTDRIVSGDGGDFWDLASSIMKIGTEDSGFDWGLSKEKQLTVRGRFESNKEGAQIIIDPETREFLMDANGLQLCNWTFSGDRGYTMLKQYSYGAKGVKNSSSTLQGGSLSTSEYDYDTGRETIWTFIGLGSIGINSYQDAARLWITMRGGLAGYNELEVIMRGLPTSKYQLESGQLWRDGEIVKIVP